MNDKKRIVVTFRGPEAEALSRVTAALNEPSDQDTIRTLVKREYDSRFTVPAYKQPVKSNTPPKETQAERRRRLESMSNEDLTFVLESSGCFTDLRMYPEDYVAIESHPVSGERIVRVKSAKGGTDDTLNFKSMMNQWEKQKFLK